MRASGVGDAEGLVGVEVAGGVVGLVGLVGVVGVEESSRRCGMAISAAGLWLAFAVIDPSTDISRSMLASAITNQNLRALRAGAVLATITHRTAAQARLRLLRPGLSRLPPIVRTSMRHLLGC